MAMTPPDAATSEESSSLVKPPSPTELAPSPPPPLPVSVMTKPLHIVAHTLPALALVLVGIWMGSVLTSYVKSGDIVTPNKLAGFSWAYADGHVFNWHPLLMTFGFVFCSSQAALVYITLPFPHETNKKIHLALHSIAAVSALVGSIAVFRFHNEHKITNLYSLHSWLGALVWFIFVIQWAFGVYAYFYPGASPTVRASSLPYHIGGGIGVLALIYATAATGVLEKLSFNASCNVSGALNGEEVVGFMASDCKLGNSIGLVLALSLVAVIVVIIEAKLAPRPSFSSATSETVPLVSNGAASKQQGYHHA
ncbi:hypothetical protein Poli38472_011810 [Pythium oligandrum]|uniref:Cytochrome b561 domain-containing protein n=1 Tax=Pythium oligandrum TaxID=41045 RepID=A0A8K1C7X9_PYTOL|nr:hypothetical protein Poli38472_011810 [Pythium oligandrum]|eukprot:TMW58222.1 hypothetical protein Poli38472_011810 [Pythium oligandrum]